MGCRMACGVVDKVADDLPKESGIAVHPSRPNRRIHEPARRQIRS